MKLKLHKQKIRKRSRTQTANGAYEYVFLATVTMMMLALGTVMVFSAGLASAYFDQEDSYYWLLRQLAFGAIGIICMFSLSRLDFYRLRKATPFFMTASLALLLLVLIPGLGVENNGARRWLALSVVNPQPSEIAKLAVVLSLAAAMSSRPRLLTSAREMSLRILVLPAAVCFLVLIEPDLGTAIAIAVTVLGMLLVGGVRLKVMATPILGATVLGLLSVMVKPHQMDRLTAFIDPWQDANGTGHQIIQSWYAIGSGGLSGVGLGNSVQKFYYLPEPHTDMIFSIIGEEIGLLGALMVIGGFSAFGYMGFRIAIKCRNTFGKYVAAGITSMVVGQAAINLCAVTGLMPLTGVPLPLISYGGSSLIIILSSIGILLNIAVNPRSKIAAAPQRKISAAEGGNRGRRNGRSPGAGAGSRRRAHG